MLHFRFRKGAHSLAPGALAGRSNPVGCWHFAVALVGLNDPAPMLARHGLHRHRHVATCDEDYRDARSIGSEPILQFETVQARQSEVEVKNQTARNKNMRARKEFRLAHGNVVVDYEGN